MFDSTDVLLAEVAEGVAPDADFAVWLAHHPDLQHDLTIARNIYALLAELREAEIMVPDGFEARLMQRLNQDAALHSLFDLGVNGMSKLLIELLTLMFGLIPQARHAQAHN
jgi:hypothetical protein